MIFINPQWQGSGFSDELKMGAATWKKYFAVSGIIETPLSQKDLSTVHEIKGFNAILEQTEMFKKIVQDSQPQKIITLGGDCGVEILPVSYLNKRYEKLFVVWIDAHPDLNSPESSPSKTFHGMALRTLLGEGNSFLLDLLFSVIQPRQVCFAGLRDIDPPEAAYIQQNNMTSFPGRDFAGIEKKANGFDHIYIHLDLDVLDKTEFPFTLFPTSNGLSVNDVANLITNLKATNKVVGLGITESIAETPEQLAVLKPILDQVNLDPQ